MANSWFRLYFEFADDPKVQIMPEHMQRRLIMLMCDRCRGVTSQERHMVFHWRVTVEELAETKALFIESGFIDEQWNLLNWDKRQFVSDGSADRTRRYRERLAMLQKRHGDVTVTGPDTDTESETDTEQIHKKTIAPSPNGHSANAPPIGTLPCVGPKKSWPLHQSKVDEWQASYPGVNVKAELREARQWLIDNPTKRKTFSGMTRFLSKWLATEQDRSGGNGHGTTSAARSTKADIRREKNAEDIRKFKESFSGESPD